MLRLHDMGFEVRWIEDFDHQAFARDPKAYLHRILKDSAILEWQLKHADLSAEAAKMQAYIDKQLPLESRPGTIDDIKKLLDDGWLVRLEVNGDLLIGRDGYDGHSILAIGYTDDES
jgi:hypothetical protein